MDFQKILDNMIATERANELKNSPQLLLGELILKLESVKNKKLPLFIDINNKRPKGIDSWRGRYCELAIQTECFGRYNTDRIVWQSDYDDCKEYEQKTIGVENPTVSEWINVFKEAQGKTFVGYKGGDFLMSKNTPVWLAEYGNSFFQVDKDTYERVFFTDVKELKDKVLLITKIDKD